MCASARLFVWFSAIPGMSRGVRLLAVTFRMPPWGSGEIALKCVFACSKALFALSPGFWLLHARLIKGVEYLQPTHLIHLSDSTHTSAAWDRNEIHVSTYQYCGANYVVQKSSFRFMFLVFFLRQVLRGLAWSLFLFSSLSLFH